MAAETDIVLVMENKSTEAYEAPTVTDLGRLEDLTHGAGVGLMEQNSMKT